MSQEGTKTGQCNNHIIIREPVGNQYRNQAFQAVTDECEKRGFLASYAQYIGGPGIFWTLTPGIGEAHEFAQQNCRGDWSQQVGRDD